MWWFFVPQPWAAVLWAFLPRVLVLILVQHYLGFTVWFWIHLATALLVWSGGTSVTSRRRGLRG